MAGNYRNWCFTLNNPEDTADGLLQLFEDHQHFRFVVFQREESCNESTPHFQGYAEFKQTLRFAAVKKLLPTAHWEHRRGTQAQAIAYCKKEESHLEGPWEAGTPGGRQGKRSDIDDAVDLLRQSRSIRDVIEEHAVAFVKYHRGMERLLEVTVAPRTAAPKCILLYGPTGTGKSHWAFTKYPKAFWKAPASHWFDGYLDEKTVVFDEFAGRMSKMTLCNLLRVMDKYPLKVEIKGSSRDFLAETIIFTTNIHPRLWYDWTDRPTQWPALQRRFHEVWYFTEAFHEPVFLDHDSFFKNWYQDCDESDLFETVTRPNTPEESDEAAMILADIDDSRVSPIRRIHPTVIGTAETETPLVGGVFPIGHPLHTPCGGPPYGLTAQEHLPLPVSSGCTGIIPCGDCDDCGLLEDEEFEEVCEEFSFPIPGVYRNAVVRPLAS